MFRNKIGNFSGNKFNNFSRNEFNNLFSEEEAENIQLNNGNKPNISNVSSNFLPEIKEKKKKKEEKKKK